MSSIELKTVFAVLPFCERGRPFVFSGDPKGKNYIYSNKNNFYLRDVENPMICDVYAEHAKLATVAKYAPSGFYIASADESGKVRIWDTTQKEHILKYEYQVLSGTIKDLNWTEDSKRLVVVGEGREKCGAAIMWDTGTSVGEISGHEASINSVDVKQVRPFRVATASEDRSLAFFEGPPFKYKMAKRDHTNFVNCVRFSPDGNCFISGGADGQAFIYDGKTAERVGELTDQEVGKAHKNGIYAIAFSADGQRLASASADKTIKIWDVPNKKLTSATTFEDKLENQQLGCIWMRDNIISFSLSGFINFINPDEPSEPYRTIKGHKGPITCMAISQDRTTPFTGDSDGQIFYWNIQNGDAELMEGKGHNNNQVQDMAIFGDDLMTIGMDDCVIFSKVSSKSYGQPVSLESQPQLCTMGDGALAIVTCVKEVVVFRNGEKVSSLKEAYEPYSVAISRDLKQVAIGGKSDKMVHIYNLNGDTLEPAGTELKHVGDIKSIQYSPDGSHLAVGDSNKKVAVYSLPEYKQTTFSVGWVKHSASVRHVSWSPDSQRLLSVGSDSHVVLYSMGKSMAQIFERGHPLSFGNRIEWLDDNRALSAGQDGCMRLWTIHH